jgi:hypothetical protein
VKEAKENPEIIGKVTPEFGLYCLFLGIASALAEKRLLASRYANEQCSVGRERL